ncbi:type III secretion system protein [Leclercia adecarboxylata]|nr:type III secretion system protein [Leclercia adecarboxylata]KMN64139.1 type III secretion system protein [Leclercia sp. LK8]
MNEVTEMMHVPETKQSYTLKVLFGPMFGSELHLPANDYFFIINPGPAITDKHNASVKASEHSAAYLQNTLYIPCDLPSPNLIIHLPASNADAENPCSFHVDVQDEKKSFTATLQENEIFFHEHIRFAIKRSEDEWLENIKHFVMPEPLDARFSQQEKLAVFNTKKYHSLIMGAALLLGLLTVAAFIWYKKLENAHQVLSINEALAGSPVPLEIVRAREGNIIYVLATKYQALEWAKEAIIKLREDNSIVPVWLNDQKKIAVDKLVQEDYPLLQIDYSKPQHPIIALWSNLTPEQKKKFTGLALQTIPFAKDIQIKVKTKSQLLEEARQGLDRIHINYRVIKSPDGYALVIRDALSDHALAALHNFINDFNQHWGNRIINFPINLNENWLENKSYLDSKNGYLFLNPRHWYFPLKNGDKDV